MDDVVLQTVELGRPWQTVDPFLFCVHHDDDFPEGDEEFGPCAPLVGRNIGSDFSGRDGWSMYHGSQVPGFPQHPHRGFETISFMRKGIMDHSDSLGAAARFGKGDVQWMTAGSGIVHSEMFPLLDREARNQTELFQIWINLPATDKMVPPHFSMLWNHQIPKHTLLDAAGRTTEVTVVAGELVAGHRAPAPPPHSWASRRDSDVGIYHAQISPEGSWTLPATADDRTVRTVYVFRGGSVRALRADATGRQLGTEVVGNHAAVVRPDVPLTLTDTGDGAEVLVLQGRPIGEPIVQYGPFVMNTKAEIQKAFADYQETHFGGWPWPVDEPNHGADLRRFAKHADGRVEELAAS
ncbi:pirin family protein [Nitriliruptoraceae bacterium ZYF776]|nr:pirin family protein [Profundirhabdus halotolerans]